MKNFFRFLKKTRIPEKSTFVKLVFGASVLTGIVVTSKKAYCTNSSQNISQFVQNPFQRAKSNIYFIVDEQDNKLAIAILLNNMLVFYLAENTTIFYILSKKLKIYAQKFEESEKQELTDIVIKEDENLIFCKIFPEYSTDNPVSYSQNMNIGDSLLAISIDEEQELNISGFYLNGNLKISPNFSVRTQKVSGFVWTSPIFSLALDECGQFAGFILPGSNELISRTHVLGLTELARNNQKLERPYLGVSVKETLMSPDKKGLLVVNVSDGSPFQNAGIKMGDLIYEVDGQEVSNVKNFVNLIGYERSRKVPVTLIHKNQKKIVDLDL